MIKNAEFVKPLSLHENIDYVREVLANTVSLTGNLTDYKDVDALDEKHRFFSYNKQFNSPIENNPSHAVINAHIKKNGQDYRFETQENPIKNLRDRLSDNVKVGTHKKQVECKGFKGIKSKK